MQTPLYIEIQTNKNIHTHTDSPSVLAERKTFANKTLLSKKCFSPGITFIPGAKKFTIRFNVAKQNALFVFSTHIYFTRWFWSSFAIKSYWLPMPHVNVCMLCAQCMVYMLVGTSTLSLILYVIWCENKILINVRHGNDQTRINANECKWHE